MLPPVVENLLENTPSPLLLFVRTFDHLHLLVRRLEWEVGWGMGGNREPTNIDMMRDASATSNLEFIVPPHEQGERERGMKLLI